MQLFVANVGVNTFDTKTRGLKSPIFPDGTFEFVPIKERSDLASRPEIPAYRDLTFWTGRASLADYLPETVRHYRAHVDPEFETFTYGDISSARAANLVYVRPGDLLWFVARVWSHDGKQWTGESDFYFIGFLKVEENIQVSEGETPETLAPHIVPRISQNAHYRRLLAGVRDRFRIIVGHRKDSKRFNRALRATPDVISLIYGGKYDESQKLYRSADNTILENKNGRPRRFETFGSVTRTIQAFLNSDVPEQTACIDRLVELATENEG